MPLESDITINAAKFAPQNISEQTSKFNDYLIGIVEGGPKWWDVGAQKYRELRIAGKTWMPPPKLLPQGLDIEIPSRDAGRNIPCRLIYPSSRTSPEDRKKTKGVVYHIHGGGWVLGDHISADMLLQHYADAGDLAVISVGYRLAPEDTFPKGPEDCIDVGEYLQKNSVSEYGGPLRFIGGESAGAHLSVLVAFHLLKSYQKLDLTGLLLHFGCYDLSLLPSVYHFQKQLVLDHATIAKFAEAFLPGVTGEGLKDPSISPYYEDIEKFRGRLPNALFTCGSEDALLDDSVNMGTKWLMAGGEAIIKIYTGAPHGFIGFPEDVCKEAGEVQRDVKTYIQDRMAQL